MVFEDFHPIDDCVGLVARGPTYTGLNEAVEVPYELRHGEVKFGEVTGDCVFSGDPPVRLGNRFNGVLTVSANRIIYINGAPIGPGHQPYLFDHGLLFQQDLSIYLSGAPLIERWGDKKSLGRPSGHGDFVLFEGRTNPAPLGWEVWVYDMNTGKKKKLLNHGANPYYYNGKLFYSHWKDGEFISRYVEMRL